MDGQTRVLSQISIHPVTQDDLGGGRAMVTFKGAHFEATIIRLYVRWYLAYPLS
jgi:hypothetical protein